MPDEPTGPDPVLQLNAQLHASTAEVPTSSWGRMRRVAGAAMRMARASRRRDGEGVPDADDVARVVSSLGELKGIAMKVGQMLSYVDASLPAETRQLLALLQTQSQPTPFARIEEIIGADLPAEADAILRRLDPVPIATASIGQVHRGFAPDGRRVAVKVAHPGIDAAIRADFRAAAIGKVMGSLLAPGADVKQVIKEAEARFLEECDYVLEAQRQRHFAACFAGDPVIVVPEVHDAWCSPRVLTTDWMRGMGLERWLAGDPSDEARATVSVGLYRFYVGALYRHGFFNADPHPGNLVFLDDGRVAVLDYGCVRAFDTATVRSLARLSQAVVADDRAAIRHAMVSLGARDPRSAKLYDTARTMLRSFYQPLLTPGTHVLKTGDHVTLGASFRTKRALMRLRLPGKLLFLFRIRFGLHAVLERIAAPVDWQATERALTDAVLR